MKKNVWLLGVAVAALTSCTQNEVLEVPESKLIRFEEFVEKNSRAELEDVDLTNASLSKYWVYGYYTPIGYFDDDSNPETPDIYGYDFATRDTFQVFNGMNMYKEDGAWEYGDTDHWKPNNMYRFAAYSDGNNILTGVSYDAKADELKFEDYTVFDADSQESPRDLVASIAGDRNASSGTSPVEFNFRHLLAKVTIYVTNASENADIELENIKIGGLYKTADCRCVFSAGQNAYPLNVTWTPQDQPDDFSYGSLQVEHGVGGQTHGEVTFYVIPQSNNKTLRFRLAQTIKKGDGKDYSSEDLDYNLSANTQVTSTVMKTNEWVAGYHYRYTITKGTTFNQIQFHVAVDGWNRNRDGVGDVTVDDNVDLTAAP